MAKKYPSEALQADALHFSTDVLSTLVVILGIVGVWVGMKFGIAWLSKLDALAALAVAGVIIWIGSRLGKRTIDALLDVAPSGLREQISSKPSRQRTGVLQAERVRVRRAGQRYFVDVTISVPRTASLEQAHAAKRKRGEKHRRNDSRGCDRSRGAARPEGRASFRHRPRHRTDQGAGRPQELSAHHHEGHLLIDLHLEVDEKSSLNEAHRQATELEDEILRVTSEGTRVTIHIEPQGATIGGSEEMEEVSRSVQVFLNSLQKEYGQFVDCHDVYARSADHKVLVSCHCSMSGKLPITEVHDITAAL